MTMTLPSRRSRTGRLQWPALLPAALPLLLAAALVAGCGRGSGEASGTGGNGAAPGAAGGGQDIVVGEYGSLTGGTATFGKQTHNGVELAIDEVNAAGGVKGRKLRLVTEDDQSRQDEAATVVRKLISRDKVIALLGEVASSASLAAAPIAQEAKVPMISPSSTNPRVTQVGDFIFRVCFLDDFQGQAMARFCYNTLGSRKAAVLRDIRQDYSVGLANYFSEEFAKLGGTIASDQSYSSGDSDFKAQLTAIRAAGADVLFVPGYYNDVGQVAIQARDLGLKIPLAGGDGWESPNLLEIGGQALENSYYSNHFDPSSQEPVVKEFFKKYSDRYGQAPGALAALAYDAAHLLADAMGRAPEISGTAIRDQIAVTKDWKGVSGTITMDKNRNPVKPLTVLQIKDGKITLRETIQPF